MSKHVFFVHGRNFKPDLAILQKEWLSSVEHGLQREFGAELLGQFHDVKKTFIYYGDISNRFLASKGKSYDKAADIRDRQEARKQLMSYASSDFDDRSVYENLPGKSALKEALADVFGRALFFTGISDNLISAVAPDMAHYWNQDHQFGSDIRWRLTEPLADAMAAGDEILMVCHSLGSIVAFDVLWKFSHYGEYQFLREKKIQTWITLGSPLGDATVIRNLKGRGAKGQRRFPDNICRWHNVAAEDDFIAYDQTVENDYRLMISEGLIRSILDHRIYNLSVRGGKSNPHFVTGYLMSPVVAGLIGNWLNDDA